MRAVVLDAFGAELRFAGDHPDPDGSGEVIDVTACGVCHSDLHVVDGEIPSPLPLDPRPRGHRRAPAPGSGDGVRALGLSHMRTLR